MELVCISPWALQWRPSLEHLNKSSRDAQFEQPECGESDNIARSIDYTDVTSLCTWST